MKYKKDLNGDLQLTEYNEADGALFNYTQSLIGSQFVRNPDSSLADFRGTGAAVADIINGDLRQISNSLINYKKVGSVAQKTTKNLQLSPIKGQEIDETSYRFWVRNNMELLAKYAKSGLTYRNLVIAKYENGAFRAWFDEYIRETLEASTGGSE